MPVARFANTRRALLFCHRESNCSVYILRGRHGLSSPTPSPTTRYPYFVFPFPVISQKSFRRYFFKLDLLFGLFSFSSFFFNIPLEVESLDCLEIYEGLFSERNDRKIRGNIDRLFTFLLFFVLFYFILGKLGRWWSFRSWRTSFWSFSVKFSETEWYKINREKNIWEANLYYEVILSFKKCPAYSTASCYALSRICSSNAIVNTRFTRLGRKTYSREDT